MNVVAFYVPHNEGSVAGIVVGPGFDSKFMLVDLFEVDASLQSFASLEEARTWMQENHTDDGDPEFEEVEGGLLRVVEYS